MAGDDGQLLFLPEANGVSLQLYDMNVRQVIEAGRYTVVNPDSKRWLYQGSMYAPNRYPILMEHAKRVFKINRENVLASFVTHGTSVLQHMYGAESRKLKNIQDELTQTDFPLACELFYQEPNGIFDYQLKKKSRAPRGHLNVFAHPETVYPPLAALFGGFQVSLSEGFAIAFATSALTWVGLPESARPLFQEDVNAFNEMVRKRIDHVNQYIQ